jgi:hypothetical protein
LDSAGYLSHLAIELVLKAFLLVRIRSFRDDHSLAKLLRTVQANGTKVALSEDQITTIRRLDEFYHLRYPQTDGSASIGDVDWDAIRSLASALLEQLPENLQSDVVRLDRTKKSGRALTKKPKDSPLFEGHVLVVKSQK